LQRPTNGRVLSAFMRSYAVEHRIRAFTCGWYSVVHFTYQVDYLFTQETGLNLLCSYGGCGRMQLWWQRSRKSPNSGSKSLGSILATGYMDPSTPCFGWNSWWQKRPWLERLQPFCIALEPCFHICRHMLVIKGRLGPSVERAFL